VPVEDLAGALADRPGWTVALRVATYAPAEGGWSAAIHQLVVTTRRYDRWHVAVRDPAGRVVYATPTSTLPEAIRVAEGQVRARSTEAPGST